MGKLDIKNISKSYGKHKALDNISLTLEAGVYGLLGPNGAGKSTLINIITGLIPPDSGTVEYRRNNIKVSISEVLGFLPQYHKFYGNFTAEEFLLYISELKGIPQKKDSKYIYELLDTVNLTENAKKKIRTFSGGMKQRLGIAQALVGDPEIIIFDEPTAGLDPKERIRFRNIISSLGSDKIVILATHIVSDVAYIAKEVIFIDKGRLLFSESQENVTRRLRDKVWVCKCKGDEILALMNSYRVSNVSPDKNDFTVRIISEVRPFDFAETSVPTLDDACLYYFGEM